MFSNIMKMYQCFLKHTCSTKTVNKAVYNGLKRQYFVGITPSSIPGTVGRLRLLTNSNNIIIRMSIKSYINNQSIINFKALIFIFAVFLIVFTSCQDPRPDACIGHPDLLMRFCCIQPPYFTRDVAKECGAGFEILVADMQKNVTGVRRLSYTECGHWYCVLNKYALITNDGFVDHEKFFAHLDVWVTLNPIFTKVMVKAKQRCAQSYRLFLPLKPCEFFSLLMCVRNYINKMDCPTIFDTPECKQQKEFFRRCGEFFID